MTQQSELGTCVRNKVATWSEGGRSGYRRADTRTRRLQGRTKARKAPKSPKLRALLNRFRCPVVEARRAQADEWSTAMHRTGLARQTCAAWRHRMEGREPAEARMAGSQLSIQARRCLDGWLLQVAERPG